MEKYKLSIFGKGGHGAEPNEAIDTAIITSEFVRKSTKYKNIELSAVLPLMLSPEKQKLF